MPIQICRSCGRQSNSATSDYWQGEVGVITKCYLAWSEEKQWEKGCAFDSLDDTPFGKAFYEKMLSDLSSKNK